MLSTHLSVRNSASDSLSSGFSSEVELNTGCTHFPVFEDALAELLPAGTRIVDSAATTAARVKAALASEPGQASGQLTLLATDGVSRFRRVGSYFLGAPIASVELVDL